MRAECIEFPDDKSASVAFLGRHKARLERAEGCLIMFRDGRRFDVDITTIDETTIWYALHDVTERYDGKEHVPRELLSACPAEDVLKIYPDTDISDGR